ncbi:SMC-Scp complex subunit ScpB [Afifella marina]|uniref:Segregation and condensation protein B n=1 Tax=Afifella marina DSM 2698 TaxID=1120955 RepID=A0A1G5P7F3_AFIMA|nr:segregation and condensation protein B [Afifella marina DSM 2698]
MPDLFASGSNVTSLSPEDRRLHLRMLEAMLFASAKPMSEAELAAKMPEGVTVDVLLHELQTAYASRGVNLRRIGDCWAFRTASDLGFLLQEHKVEERKLSRAAMETLAIIAYHQPVTRAEIEEVRGVSTSKGTLDVLLETGWVRPRGRRRSPGRPLTFGTTNEFLDHFGLAAIGDLPGLLDLKAAGLLNANIPPGFEAPPAFGSEGLRDDEDPLDGD